jgi:isopentenyl diphosphate isomerase/L-lactate dehydrogenase-like FMN-dependent dehydrogenase
LCGLEPIHDQLNNIFDYAILAKERMNPVYWDYYEGGSDDEVTIHANQADFARIHLRPRMLVDVTNCDTGTTVLGIDWLRSITSLPILIKGILTTEDALLALEHGVSGNIVSNHGGRQLDGVVTSIEVLPEIVEVVAGRCEVYMDSGIRRGTDILKALALGAHAVLVGRPILWGLAVDGAHGVQQVLEILRTDSEKL